MHQSVARRRSLVAPGLLGAAVAGALLTAALATGPAVAEPARTAGAATASSVVSCSEDDVLLLAGSIADGSAFAQLPAVSAFAAALATSPVAGLLPERAPFTILAPSDVAFEALDPTSWEALLNDPSLLASVVAAHVIVGRAYGAEQLIAASPVATLNRVDLLFELGTGDAGAFAAAVAGTDGGAGVVCVAEFADGFVYVLDAVLQPPHDACAPGGVPGSSVPGSSVPAPSIPRSSIPGVVC